MGWAVQGIWPAQNEGCDIVSCDVNMSGAVGDNKVVATGDSYGRVRLFKYPVQSSYAISRAHHSATGR